MFLAGDVGGTKINLALCEVSDAGGVMKITVHALRRYASAQFGSLSEVLIRYLGEAGPLPQKITGACFGVPGPVLDGRCQTVNLPWVLNAEDIYQETARTFPIGSVHLINDLEATGFGLRTLQQGNGLF